MAATRRNAAGKVTVPPARLTRMTPSSSGWRSASSAATGNSPSSSRNRTPLVARLASPGRSDQLPPPTRETTEAWWWGARKGGRSNRAPSGRAQPAAEWMRATVSASWSVSGGRRPTRRSASIVLPEPGGPIIRRWWRPAAATSMARRPRAWPRTSARSGTPAAAGAAEVGGGSGHPAWPRRARVRSPSVAAPRTSDPRTSAASRTSPSGTTRPSGAEASARAIMPGTWRNEPFSPSSPQKARPSVQPGGSSPVATRRPMAIGQVEPRSPFAHAGGSEVDNRPAQRPRQATGQHGGTHPVARLAHRGVGQADDGEPGKAVRDVDLDRNRAADGTGQCRGGDGGVCTSVNGRIDRSPTPDMFETWER